MQTVINWFTSFCENDMGNKNSSMSNKSEEKEGNNGKNTNSEIDLVKKVVEASGGGGKNKLFLWGRCDLRRPREGLLGQAKVGKGSLENSKRGGQRGEEIREFEEFRYLF